MSKDQSSCSNSNGSNNIKYLKFTSVFINARLGHYKQLIFAWKIIFINENNVTNEIDEFDISNLSNNGNNNSSSNIKCLKFIRFLSKID